MSSSPHATSGLYTTSSSFGFLDRWPLSLRSILVLALVIRVAAAFFSRGFAFHDDHFDVISIAQDWVYGVPTWLHEAMPPRHSMFYVGLHYILFYLCDSLGFTSPDGKMILVRLLHGIYSVLTVYLGYKITATLAGKREAKVVGVMLALMWFMPFMSVRNLVEMVCIPPYLAGFYLLLKPTAARQAKHYFWSGTLFALAFVFRYHTFLLSGGVVLILLYQRQWRHLVFFSLGFLLTATLIQGTIDAVFFDYPFHSVVTYFFYNTGHANDFSTGPVYRFLLTILGFLVPPISVFLLLGYARTARLAPMLFIGGILFFVAHSLFPNKQERFILPLLPLIMILGVLGWHQVVQNSFGQKHPQWLNGAWNFFWVLNLFVALAMAFTYTKKSRVAPLVYLSEKQNLRGILLEFGDHSAKMPPLFYLGRLSAQAEDLAEDTKNRWHQFKKAALPHNFVLVYTLNNDKPLTKLKSEINTAHAPDYVVVMGQDDLDKRLARLRSLYPRLKLEKTISPSVYDQVLHVLNPRVHKDEQVQIYQAW